MAWLRRRLTVMALHTGGRIVELRARRRAEQRLRRELTQQLVARRGVADRRVRAGRVEDRRVGRQHPDR